MSITNIITSITRPPTTIIIATTIIATTTTTATIAAAADATGDRGDNCGMIFHAHPRLILHAAFDNISRTDNPSLRFVIRHITMFINSYELLVLHVLLKDSLTLVGYFFMGGSLNSVPSQPPWLPYTSKALPVGPNETDGINYLPGGMGFGHPECGGTGKDVAIDIGAGA